MRKEYAVPGAINGATDVGSVELKIWTPTGIEQRKIVDIDINGPAKVIILTGDDIND